MGGGEGGEGIESVVRRSGMCRSAKVTFSAAAAAASWSVGEDGAAGRLGGEALVVVCRPVGIVPRAVGMGVDGLKIGGLSTSMGSGEGMACGLDCGARPVKRGFSGVESLSLSITAAVPIVGLTTEPRLRAAGRPVVFVAGGGGGGMNVCGLNVPAHSSCENFVPPGD